MDKPIIGITMGDPVSIGPEITVKALSSSIVQEKCRAVVIGDKKIMQRALSLTGLSEIVKINSIESIDDAIFEKSYINVLDLEIPDLLNLPLGIVSGKAGDAAYKYVAKVIELALQGKVQATVTNALNKEALNKGGHHFSGHTEIYAELTDTSKYTMMLAHGDLRVVHISTHVSLRKACDLVKKDRIIEVIKIANDACKSLGINHPKIAVAGLNPHSGENGLFGDEEINEIIPAIQEAIKDGVRVEGPVPPDTVFSKAKGGWYDVVVAMYHDQGHIPLKIVGFNFNRELNSWDAVEGVNITLGLPIIRTSVDHGTAFDSAGKGTANELSLINAIEYAIQLASHKKM